LVDNPLYISGEGLVGSCWRHAKSWFFKWRQ